ncbi:MAG: RHS repeat-associated core domain-containing protein [Bacillota bacterium]
MSDAYFEDGTSLNYKYDGFGRKASRSEEYWAPEGKDYKLRNETTNYLFNGTSVLKEYEGEGGPLAEYYTGNDQVFARNMFGYHGRKDDDRYGNLRTRGGLMYYNYDALGNVTDLTDHLGDNIVKYRFDAFGGMFAGTLAPYSFQGITGKEYDPKSGLMFYNSRWYDPAVGRFTQADAFKGFAVSPASQNPYAYVGNNPINNIDPTGHANFVRNVPLYIDDVYQFQVELRDNGRTYFTGYRLSGS